MNSAPTYVRMVMKVFVHYPAPRVDDDRKGWL